jgi:hypothetical protein
LPTHGFLPEAIVFDDARTAYTNIVDAREAARDCSSSPVWAPNNLTASISLMYSAAQPGRLGADPWVRIQEFYIMGG